MCSIDRRRYDRFTASWGSLVGPTIPQLALSRPLLELWIPIQCRGVKDHICRVWNSTEADFTIPIPLPGRKRLLGLRAHGDQVDTGEHLRASITNLLSTFFEGILSRSETDLMRPDQPRLQH